MQGSQPGETLVSLPLAVGLCVTPGGLSLILSELLLRADPYLRAGSWAGAEP